jgi:hypothetical protein
MQPHDLKRIGLLLFSFAVNAFVGQWVVKYSSYNILEAVQISGQVMVLFAVPLYAFGLVLRTDSTVKGYQPELGLQTILLFVYGLGFFLFVAVFSFLGVVITPMFWFTLGMAALAADESVVGQRGRVYPYANWICIVGATVPLLLLVIFSSHIPASMGEAIDKGDFISILFGILLPVLVCIVPYLVRSRGGYSTQQVVHFMQWGYPTLFLLGAGVFCLAPCDTKFPNVGGQRRALLGSDQNLTLQNVSYTETHAHFNISQQYRPTPANISHQHELANVTGNHTFPMAFMFLNLSTVVGDLQQESNFILLFAPLTLFPVVFLTFQAMLQYTTLDIICVNTAILTVKHMLLHPDCFVAGPAVLIAGIAIALRLLNLSATPTPVERVPTRFYVEEIAEYNDF